MDMINKLTDYKNVYQRAEGEEIRKIKYQIPDTYYADNFMISCN